MANTTTTKEGIDIYINKINALSDEYINNILNINPDNAKDPEYKKIIADNFTDMIFYISDNINKPGNDDINLLDGIFNIYIRLCSRYSVLPSLEVFSFLVGINNGTFSDWADGQYRTSSGHGETVKKWKNICKGFTVNRLQNQTGTNANLIFVAKAAYGMVEAPQQVQVISGQAPEQIAADIAARHSIGDTARPQLPEDL